MKKTITEYGPETPGYAQLNEQQRQQQQPKKKQHSKSSKKSATTVSKSVLPLILLAGLLLLPACATSKEGLDREARISQAVQRGMDYTRDNILPLVPSPWKEAIAFAGIAGGAALTAWNHSQGKRIKTLENGAVKTALIVPPLPIDKLNS